MTSVVEQLFILQKAQLDHDELYHKEITRLSIQHRLNHMALHFSKYVGNICNSILTTNDQEVLKKNIIDTFIISTTSANILNINISEKIPTNGLDNISDLFGLSSILTKHFNIDISDQLWLLKHYPIAVGKLAKACESADHLEPYPFRESICEQVVLIHFLMLIAASQINVDLFLEVPNRLDGVKRKSIFYGHFMSKLN